MIQVLILIIMLMIDLLNYIEIYSCSANGYSGDVDNGGGDVGNGGGDVGNGGGDAYGGGDVGNGGGDAYGGGDDVGNGGGDVGGNGGGDVGDGDGKVLISIAMMMVGLLNHTLAPVHSYTAPTPRHTSKMLTVRSSNLNR